MLCKIPHRVTREVPHSVDGADNRFHGEDLRRENNTDKKIMTTVEFTFNCLSMVRIAPRSFSSRYILDEAYAL